ncbi:PIG-L deacetylase family protein [Xylanimonas protaetiae]|uniref:PIG-L family deacetylase n=1 Tax=Xylanimonas protaetiae TaxID=2509457 RepID=A0A4P6EZX0_9MICO|nr:PIG-L deacetylase family protein [Xylanimonas protaetiae]QAY69020.1 PIG-L family deacetylase [Xylanimonas protaetiae]
MIALGLPYGELSVLAIGAHPDDIEIACGGTLLTLADRGKVRATFATMTGEPARKAEAMAAAQAFVPGARSLFWDLPDGRLPAHWSDVKEALESLGSELRPDLILSPSRDDSHQDHRLVAELIPTVWRDTLVLEYEIPKWDGDLGSVSTYVPVGDEMAHRKVELLTKHYASQIGRDWWDDEMFLGLMRLRGVECRHRYAEGFVVRKVALDVGH